MGTGGSDYERLMAEAAKGHRVAENGWAKAGDDESDSSGRSARGQTFAVQLWVPGEPVRAVCFGWITDDIEMGPDREWIAFTYANRRGDWRVKVTGKRLTAIYDQLCEAKRVSIKPSGPVEGDKRPQVDAITVEKAEPVEFE